MPTDPQQDRNVEARASELREVYRVEQFGDGSGVWFVDSWNEVISTVANGLYSPVEPHDLEEVRQMLADGVDGNEGWNGNSVVLQFEDGSTSVERFVLAAWNSRPSQPPLSEARASECPNCGQPDGQHHNLCQQEAVWELEESVNQLEEKINDMNNVEAGDASGDVAKGVLEEIERLYKAWNPLEPGVVANWLIDNYDRLRLALSATSSHGEKEMGELAKRVKQILERWDEVGRDSSLDDFGRYFQSTAVGAGAIAVLREHAPAIVAAASNAERLKDATALLHEVVSRMKSDGHDGEKDSYCWQCAVATSIKAFLSPVPAQTPRDERGDGKVNLT